MVQKELSHSTLTLGEVKKQFKLWRKTRKSPKPIPVELWDAAAKLSEKYTINQISKALCLNHTSLKEHAHKMKEASIQEIHPPSFVEIDLEQSPLLSECIVEMEDSAGEKMKMCFKERGRNNFPK